MALDWQDYFSSSATEIIARYRSKSSELLLSQWLAKTHRALGGERLSRDMFELFEEQIMIEAAHERIERSAELSEYDALLFEYDEEKAAYHLNWLLSAPDHEIIAWCEQVAQ